MLLTYMNTKGLFHMVESGIYMNQETLRKEIKSVRFKLNSLINKYGELDNKEVLELCQKLDSLITVWYRKNYSTSFI